MRLKPDVQVGLIPLLFQSLPNRSTAHQELLMGLVVYALQHLKIIPHLNENIVKYGLTDQPDIRRLFLNFLLNVLLLPYKYVCPSSYQLAETKHVLFRFDETKARTTTTSTPRTHIEPSQAPVDEVLFSTMEDAPAKEVEVFKQPFPCMNEPLYNRIIEAIQTDELEQVERVSATHPALTSPICSFQLKVGILKFLNGSIYSENEIIFHFVLATADPRYS